MRTTAAIGRLALLLGTAQACSVGAAGPDAAPGIGDGATSGGDGGAGTGSGEASGTADGDAGAASSADDDGPLDAGDDATDGDDDPAADGDDDSEADDGGDPDAGADGSAGDGSDGPGDDGPVDPGCVPAPAEICDNGIDDDCDGLVDEDPDADGDGWSVCDGDCCDAPPCSNTPELINPGAYDWPTGGVDDDCSGAADDPDDPCDGSFASNEAMALPFAQTLEACRETTGNAQGPARTWGVIDAYFETADGNDSPHDVQKSIRTDFGTATVPQGGYQLVLLSTGQSADVTDLSPPFFAFQYGVDTSVESGPPADWLAAQTDDPPLTVPGCAGADVTTVENPVALHLRMRVPTNAHSFSIDARWFTPEYPEYVCAGEADRFLVLLDSSHPTVPADKNIATLDVDGTALPLTVDLADVTDVFSACENGSTGQCATLASGSYSGCESTAGLAGTGMHFAYETPHSCGFDGVHGAGTDWFSIAANVVPGEEIQLRFILWDSVDPLFDSVVVLDNLRWSAASTTVGVTL